MEKKHNGLEKIHDSFYGMTDRESVSHQLKHWVKGTPLHNTIRDECCPDFSCCNGGNIMPVEARKSLANAYSEGDESAVQKICMFGLSGLTTDMGVKVHISGDDNVKH